jgi:phage gpG-like protein
MSIEYTVAIKADRTIKLLERLEDHFPRIERLIVSRIAERVVSITQAEKLRGQVLNRQSGDLAASIHYRLRGNATAVVGTNMVYAAIHEFGGTIRAKNAEFLAFRLDGGRYVMTKEVQIPARPYLGPTMTEYFDSGKAKRLVELTLKEEIERLERSV